MICQRPMTADVGWKDCLACRFEHSQAASAASTSASGEPRSGGRSIDGLGALDVS